MTYISIIIPAHNSSSTLPELIKSIKKERVKEIEIIIVDDGSSDETEKIVNSLKLKTKIKINYFKFKKSHGPAHARNFGVEKAKGNVLLFLDADVVLDEGALQEVRKIFREDKYKVAATGVWDKKQNTTKFFPKFKALRDWSYWINERKADSYYYLFSTRIAAVRRDVFLKLGGFNESFKGADVEDIEFTYRLAKKYRVDFNEKMRVFHQFEDFWPIAKKYFRRAYQWVEIFQNRKKFDPVATTSSEALTTVSAVGLTGGTIILLALELLKKIFNFQYSIFNQFTIDNIQIFFLFLTLFFFLLHFWGVRKFIKFVFKEEGFVFAVKSFFVGIALYLFIFSGAVWGMVRKKVLKI